MSEYEDQAKTLRIMVSSSGSYEPPEPSERASSIASRWVIPHRVIVVVGGCRGAGATTVARNLAAGAVQRGVRAVYVEPSAEAAPVLGSADYYLLDGGASAEFAGIADYLVLVASPDAAAVKGVYIALKRFRRADPDLEAGIVVNRVSAPEEGSTLAERIAAAARAFIGGPGLEVLGWAIEDRTRLRSGRAGEPLLRSNPRSAAAAGMRLCARRLWSRWRPREIGIAA